MHWLRKIIAIVLIIIAIFFGFAWLFAVMEWGTMISALLPFTLTAGVLTVAQQYAVIGLIALVGASISDKETTAKVVATISNAGGAIVGGVISGVAGGVASGLGMPSLWLIGAAVAAYFILTSDSSSPAPAREDKPQRGRNRDDFDYEDVDYRQAQHQRGRRAITSYS